MRGSMRLLMVLAVLALSTAVSAQTAALAMSMPQQQTLLTGYWKCHDVSDATEGTGQMRFPESDLEICSKISKAVQVLYFDDDFGQLHDWTVKNRKLAPTSIR